VKRKPYSQGLPGMMACICVCNDMTVSDSETDQDGIYSLHRTMSSWEDSLRPVGI